MRLPKSLRRRLMLILALMLVGLLRAERGGAELENRADEPSRLLRLKPDGDGTWTVALLGWEARVPATVTVFDGGRPLLSRETLAGVAPRTQQFIEELREKVTDMKEALP